MGKTFFLSDGGGGVYLGECTEQLGLQGSLWCVRVAVSSV